MTSFKMLLFANIINTADVLSICKKKFAVEVHILENEHIKEELSVKKFHLCALYQFYDSMIDHWPKLFMILHRSIGIVDRNITMG